MAIVKPLMRAELSLDIDDIGSCLADDRNVLMHVQKGVASQTEGYR